MATQPAATGCSLEPALFGLDARLVRGLFAALFDATRCYSGFADGERCLAPSVRAAAAAAHRRSLPVRPTCRLLLCVPLLAQWPA